MSMKRLTQSERNAIIADFTAGNPTPGYDVIPSKSQKGRYTIRRKKEEKAADSAPPEATEESAPQESTEEVNQEAPAQENDDDDDVDLSYIPSFKMNKNAMFREMQMQMNRLLLEQMKMIRQQQKWSVKKQKKMKERTKQIHEIITAPPVEEIYEEPEEDVDEVEVDAPQQRTNTDYFANDYQNNQPVKQVQPPKEPEPVPEKEYENDYERDVDDMAGESIQFYIPSRNDRYNFKNFPI